ncbi:MAG: hypothetical protein GF329_00680 [Candidatus Lokiarchaeota archaeon]|nr:hypothetical protein [Candidatus Lokiarchaeota archaeon]
MNEKSYRAYLLIRLTTVGKEWKVIDRIKELKSEKGNWKITYASPVYGAWDAIAEISFQELSDLDEIVTESRTAETLKDIIEETTTVVCTRKDYPW